MSGHKKIHCGSYILQSESRAFGDCIRSVLSEAMRDYMRHSLSSFSALSVNPLRVSNGVSKATGNLKIAYEYIDVLYLLCLL